MEGAEHRDIDNLEILRNICWNMYINWDIFSIFPGLGFADRSDSFDLNVALQEHFKYIEKSAEFNKEQMNDQPKLDLGFKKGQTITINFGVGVLFQSKYV